MPHDEERSTSTRREPSFWRVFAAVWGGILVSVLFVALAAGGSTWWVVPETIVVLMAVAVILYELSLLLNDEESHEGQVSEAAEAVLAARRVGAPCRVVDLPPRPLSVVELTARRAP